MESERIHDGETQLELLHNLRNMYSRVQFCLVDVLRSEKIVAKMADIGVLMDMECKISSVGQHFESEATIFSEFDRATAIGCREMVFDSHHQVVHLWKHTNPVNLQLRNQKFNRCLLFLGLAL